MTNEEMIEELKRLVIEEQEISAHRYRKARAAGTTSHAIAWQHLAAYSSRLARTGLFELVKNGEQS